MTPPTLDAAIAALDIPEGIEWVVAYHDGYYDVTLFTDRGKIGIVGKSAAKAFKAAIDDYHADVNCTLAEEKSE